MTPSYEELLRKLREEVTPASDAGEETRLRVLASLHHRAKRKRRLRLLVPLAALLSASAVLAHYVEWSALEGPGRRTPAKHAALGSSSSDGGSPREDAPIARASAEEPRRAGGALHDAGDSQARVGAESPRPSDEGRGATPPDRPPRRRSAQRATERHAGGTPLAAENAVSPTVPAQEAEALFGRAHRLHFRGDPAAALAAWDAYLAAASVGPRAREARYNRAVVLIRLGRTHEAVAALRPFAAGAHGSLRQAAAIRLLENMGAGSR